MLVLLPNMGDDFCPKDILLFNIYNTFGNYNGFVKFIVTNNLKLAF